jgi:hypothetical protein
MNTLSKLYWHFENDATPPLYFQLSILHKDVLQKSYCKILWVDLTSQTLSLRIS